MGGVQFVIVIATVLVGAPAEISPNGASLVHTVWHFDGGLGTHNDRDETPLLMIPQANPMSGEKKNRTIEDRLQHVSNSTKLDVESPRRRSLRFRRSTNNRRLGNRRQLGKKDSSTASAAATSSEENLSIEKDQGFTFKQKPEKKQVKSPTIKGKPVKKAIKRPPIKSKHLVQKPSSLLKSKQEAKKFNTPWFNSDKKKTLISTTAEPQPKFTTKYVKPVTPIRKKNDRGQKEGIDFQQRDVRKKENKRQNLFREDWAEQPKLVRPHSAAAGLDPRVDRSQVPSNPWDAVAYQSKGASVAVSASKDSSIAISTAQRRAMGAQPEAQQADSNDIINTKRSLGRKRPNRPNKYEKSKRRPSFRPLHLKPADGEKANPGSGSVPQLPKYKTVKPAGECNEPVRRSLDSGRRSNNKDLKPRRYRDNKDSDESIQRYRKKRGKNRNNYKYRQPRRGGSASVSVSASKNSASVSAATD